ncbi:MAG TPA: hypothetical protein VLY23_12375 [Candidatus Acidoferrum sp.]|nr:hypothetical protein [Candidatus Acidoferrum sp.]
MKFARMVFSIAGIWGVAILTPLFFMYDRVGRQYPPALTHPEFYYGFVGVALVWQIAFFVIATDPTRFRPIMIPAVLEKFSYVVAIAILYSQGRLSLPQFVIGNGDLVLGILFVAAFVKTSGPALRRS